MPIEEAKSITTFDQLYSYYIDNNYLQNTIQDEQTAIQYLAKNDAFLYSAIKQAIKQGYKVKLANLIKTAELKSSFLRQADYINLILKSEEYIFNTNLINFNPHDF